MVDFAQARRNMVDCQLRTNKIVDPAIIDVFASVPRELFLDDDVRAVAYVDEDIRIGADRCMMEPMVLARLLQEAMITPGEIVLDVGCATGYSTAVLSKLAATVVGLESDHGLAVKAGELLANLAADNAIVVEGPLAEGYPDQAPYDVIIVQGGVGSLPASLTGQLADGGRLVGVLDDGNGQGQAVLFLKRNEILAKRALFDANIPCLKEFEESRGFVF